MTRLVMISDTHGQLSQIKVPNGDILLHDGDWTYRGEQAEMKKFGSHIKKLPHPIKILIPGNHDLTTEENTENFHKDWLKWLNPDSTMNIVINQEFEIANLTFYCTSLVCPINNPYQRWAYETTEAEQRLIYDKYIPSKQIDIVISHSPCYGIMDENGYGSRALYDLIHRLQPKIHTFGHAHGGYGISTIDGIQYINAASCNRSYYPVNKPIIIDI